MPGEECYNLKHQQSSLKHSSVPWRPPIQALSWLNSVQFMRHDKITAQGDKAAGISAWKVEMEVTRKTLGLGWTALQIELFQFVPVQ